MRYNPVDTYLQEAEELLAAIEETALGLSAGEASGETIHQLFRAFHTIKGSGAMCGLDKVAAFTHHIETLLDRVREGAVAVTPELTGLVLSARDHIKLLLAAEQGGAAVAQSASEQLIALFNAAAGAPGTASPSRHGAPGPPVPAPAPVAASAGETWNIRFRPPKSLLTCGGNPLLLLRELAGLGECEITAHTEDVPVLEEIQADGCYLWWTVRLKTAADRNAIRDVFIFVEDDSELEIEPAPHEPAPAAQPEAGETAPKAGGEGIGKVLARESTVRVPAGRLDRLVNLVGELVMNQSRLSQAAALSGAPELATPVQEIERLIAELRDNVLGIRMLPIGTLFGRFRRLIHDLSEELGKEADLVAEGGETELDKSILDQLGEPMVHLLRNSMDHGVEPAEERVRSGKPRRATVRLSAEHTGSDVVVRIRDDGRGISLHAVRAKAVEKQLIAPDAALSDKEILNLILLPGFSTAREVTSLSGRGVGMDVVKRQIDALRGTLSISSDPGRGTCISFSLPLTLAIIEGLLVETGGDQFIIPMAAITENVELDRRERQRNNGRNVIAVRGELVPYVDLREAFRLGREAPQVEKIVIVRHEDQRVGLVVDRVVGTHQTVIQSLGRFYHNIEVVSGATIMGDGRVALILDVAAVVRFADRAAHEQLQAARG